MSDFGNWNDDQDIAYNRATTQQNHTVALHEEKARYHRSIRKCQWDGCTENAYLPPRGGHGKYCIEHKVEIMRMRSIETKRRKRLKKKYNKAV